MLLLEVTEWFYMNFSLNVWKGPDLKPCVFLPVQASLCCWPWLCTQEWLSTTTGNDTETGASPGRTSWAGCLWCLPSSQVENPEYCCIMLSVFIWGSCPVLPVREWQKCSFPCVWKRLYDKRSNEPPPSPAGIFYMCAYRMHECPRNSSSR